MTVVEADGCAACAALQDSGLGPLCRLHDPVQVQRRRDHTARARDGRFVAHAPRPLDLQAAVDGAPEATAWLVKTLQEHAHCGRDETALVSLYIATLAVASSTLLWLRRHDPELAAVVERHFLDPGT